MLFVTWALLVNVAMATDCMKHLTEPEGDILYNYTEMSANDTNISWLITGESDQVITLRINTLQLSTPKRSKCAESVFIYDGPNSSATALGQFCGPEPKTEPPVRYLRSRGNQLLIRYTSAIVGQSFVFDASYWEHECPKFQFGQVLCNMTCQCDEERTAYCVSLTGECVCREPWRRSGCSVDQEQRDSLEEDVYPDYYETTSAGDNKQLQQREIQKEDVKESQSKSQCLLWCGVNNLGQSCPCKDDEKVDENFINVCRGSKSLSVQIEVTQEKRWRKATRCYAEDVERAVKQYLQLMGLTFCGVNFMCRSLSRQVFVKTQIVEGKIALESSTFTKKVQREVMLALLKLESKNLGSASEEVTLSSVSFDGNEDCEVKQKIAPCPVNEVCSEINGRTMCRAPKTGRYNFLFLLYAAPPIIMVVVVVLLSCFCQYRMRRLMRDDVSEDSEGGNFASINVDNHGLCPDEPGEDNSEHETKVVADPEGKDCPVNIEITNETITGKEAQAQ